MFPGFSFRTLLTALTAIMAPANEHHRPRCCRLIALAKLNEVQCPVVVAPASYQQPDTLVLLYDGEPSSVHALRNFNYLFENLKRLPTEIVSVKAANETVTLPDGRLIREFAKGHYPAADAVVLGAYQRSRFSRLFKPSMADHLLQHLKLLLFIAHNKSAANAFLKNDKWPEHINTILQNVENDTQSFNEVMEAVKHSFLFKGYFKKQEKQKKATVVTLLSEAANQNKGNNR